MYISDIEGYDRGATAALLDDVRSSLTHATSSNGDEDEDESTTEGLKVRISTIEPSDCSNITSTMKALIGDFIHGDDADEQLDEDEGTDKAWKLAPYDINLLVQWYQKLRARGESTM